MTKHRARRRQRRKAALHRSGAGPDPATARGTARATPEKEARLKPCLSTRRKHALTFLYVISKRGSEITTGKTSRITARQGISTSPFPPYIIFPKNPSSLADVTWSLNIVFSALNILQRPQHRFLAKLWHKNDVFDEKKGVWGS